MLNVDDFKLVPLEELVYDQALLQGYLDMMVAISEIYDIQTLFVRGEIDLGEDYIFEEPILEKEVKRLRAMGDDFNADKFVDWLSSEWGYWSPYKDDTADTFKLRCSVMVRKADHKVLGRSNLFAGINPGKRWIGMGFDCIHPDYRGEGFGRVILAHRLAQAFDVGVDEMKLNVRSTNAASKKRIDKLKKPKIMLSERFEKFSYWTQEITYIRPPANLHTAYALLSDGDMSVAVQSEAPQHQNNDVSFE